MQAAQKAMATKAIQVFGVPRHIDPAQGLMEEYWRSAGIVLGLERIVMHIKVEDFAAPDEPTPGKVNGVERSVIEKVGPVQWMKVFNEERDRWARLGIEIVRLGLEARRDEYIRAQVEVFAQVLLDPALELTDGQRQTAARLLRGLGAKTADSIDGEVMA